MREHRFNFNTPALLMSLLLGTLLTACGTSNPQPGPSPTTVVLTVAREGNGTGTVTSVPAGITCGTDCTESLQKDTQVTLTATPAAGSTFQGWSGGCTGKTPCTVTVTQNTTVTARFDTEVATGTPARYELTSQTQVFTTEGQQATVTLKAFDASGKQVQVPAGQVQWVSSDPGVVKVSGTGKEATLTSTSKVGTTTLTAVLNNSSLQPAPLTLTRVVLKPAAKTLTDSEVVFPPPGTPVDTLTAANLPEYTLVGGGPSIAGFSATSIEQWMTTDSNGPLLPHIVTRTDLKVGDVLIGTGHSQVLAQVVQVQVKGNRSLLQLAPASPARALEDFDLQSTTSLPASTSGAAMLAPQAFSKEALTCKDPTHSGSVITADLKTFQFKPEGVTGIWTKDQIKVVVPFSVTFGVDFKANVSPTVAREVECTLARPRGFLVMIPALAGAVSAVGSLQPKVVFKSEAGAGPNLDVALSKQWVYKNTLVYCSPDCPEKAESKLEEQPFQFNLNGSLDTNVRLVGSMDAFMEAKLGVVIGGVVTDRTCKFVQLLLSEKQDFCESLQSALTFGFLVGKAGVKADMVWESLSRAATNRTSNSVFKAFPYARLDVDSTDLNKLLKFLGKSSVQLNLVNRELPLVYIYRALKGNTGTVTSDGKTQAYKEGMGVPVKRGESVNVSIQTAYNPEGVLVLSDSTPTGGKAMVNQAVLVSAGSSSASGMTVNFTIPANETTCGKSITFMGGNNFMVVVPTYGYLGTIKLNCREEKLLRLQGQWQRDYTDTTIGIINSPEHVIGREEHHLTTMESMTIFCEKEITYSYPFDGSVSGGEYRECKGDLKGTVNIQQSKVYTKYWDGFIANTTESTTTTASLQETRQIDNFPTAYSQDGKKVGISYGFSGMMKGTWQSTFSGTCTPHGNFPHCPDAFPFSNSTSGDAQYPFAAGLNSDEFKDWKWGQTTSVSGGVLQPLPCVGSTRGDEVEKTIFTCNISETGNWSLSLVDR